MADSEIDIFFEKLSEKLNEKCMKSKRWEKRCFSEINEGKPEFIVDNTGCRSYICDNCEKIIQKEQANFAKLVLSEDRIVIEFFDDLAQTLNDTCTDHIYVRPHRKWSDFEYDVETAAFEYRREDICETCEKTIKSARVDFKLLIWGNKKKDSFCTKAQLLKLESDIEDLNRKMDYIISRLPN